MEQEVFGLHKGNTWGIVGLAGGGNCDFML